MKQRALIWATEGGCSHAAPHAVRHFVEEGKKARELLPRKSQEECPERCKASPYLQGAESISGLGVTQFHGFTSVYVDRLNSV